MPHCGCVLPICLSLRPVGSIHISCLAAREQTSAAQIAKASPPYNMKYFLFILALSFNSIFNFLTEAAKYECSYRRTAHHATGVFTLYTPLIGLGTPLVVLTLRRYAKLSAVLAVPVVCLSVCHKSGVLSKRMDESSWSLK